TGPGSVPETLAGDLLKGDVHHGRGESEQAAIERVARNALCRIDLIAGNCAVDRRDDRNVLQRINDFEKTVQEVVVCRRGGRRRGRLCRGWSWRGSQDSAHEGS